MIYGNISTDGWVCGLLHGLIGWLMSGLSNYWKLNKSWLIKIIQFCLQIDDLWRYFQAHTTHWSQSLVIEIMNIIHSLTVWLFDNWHTYDFSWMCKIWYPHNLVLEHWEYLWIYRTFWAVIADCDLKLPKLSIHCHASEMTRSTLNHWLKFPLCFISCHICYRKI